MSDGTSPSQALSKPAAATAHPVCAVFRLVGALNLPMRPLRIDGLEIKFLRDALLQGCEFSELLQEGSGIWHLQFFKDSPFVCAFLLYHTQIRPDQAPKEAGEALFEQLAAQVGIDPKARRLLKGGRLILIQQEMSESALSFASLFLRGSKSLAEHQFEQRGNRQLAIDPSGLALIGTAIRAEFLLQRYSVLMALARAYQYAVDLAIEEFAMLSTGLHDPQARAQLDRLRRQSLVFSARYLFAQAVRLDTVDLRYTWERLAQVHHLRETHEELSEQLEAVHALTAFDQQQHDSQREKLTQSRLTWLGLAIALMSLLSLADVTPDKLAAFFRAWSDF